MMSPPADAPDDGAILLFDGVCPVCSRLVRFVISHDRQRRFRFASLQSAAGQRLLSHHAWSGAALSSMVLITERGC